MTSKGPGSAAEAGRVLLAEGGVYAIVEIAQQGLTLLMLPVFFFFLSVEDFGVITSAVVISQVTMFMSTLGLDFSLLRLYYVWKEDERGGLATGILYISLIWSLIVGVAVVAVLAGISRGEGHRLSLAVGAWAGLALGIRNIPLSVVRVTGAMRVYATAELVAAGTRAVLQLFLVWSGLGALGYMIGYASGPVVSTVLLLVATGTALKSRRPRWMLDRNVWSYTWRILPSLAFNRFLMVADRVALFGWSNLDGLGIYGAAARFSTSLKLLTGGFKMAIAPALSRTEPGGDDFGRVYASLSRLLLLTLLSAASGVMLAVWFIQFTPWADRWVEVERLVGVLVLAQILGGFGMLWQLGFYYSPRPQAVSYATAASAATLVASLLLLVPRLGVIGAAVAQVLAAGANLLVLARMSAREEGLFRAWGTLIGLTALFVPAVAGMWIVDAAGQLMLLLPTFLLYVSITTASLWKLRQPGTALAR